MKRKGDRPYRCEVIGCPGVYEDEVFVESKVGNIICSGMRAVCKTHFKMCHGEIPWHGPIAFVVEFVLSGP